MTAAGPIRDRLHEVGGARCALANRRAVEAGLTAGCPNSVTDMN